MPERRRVLVLFPNDWDRGEFGRDKYKDTFEFIFAGHDFFKFPGILKLVGFDPLAYVERLVDRFRSARLDGVLSSDEYLGAIMAAAVAKELGLPHSEPAQIVTAQHKYYSRLKQKEAVPEAVPDFALVPLFPGQRAPRSIPFPFFVKPVKGTFSLFAKRVESEAELGKHLDFRFWERFLLRRVTGPFNALFRRFTGLEYDANWFIGEQLIEGAQVTVDGFAFEGEVEAMGVVDSVMFPGTSTFERFDYPSRLLSKPIQERMFDVATRLVKGLGIRQAQFNIEFFYDQKNDAIKVIEINPRLSYQFADLYEDVDGSNTYDVLLDLTLGRRPRFQRGSGSYRFASSFVLRTFKGKRFEAVPASTDVDAFARQYEEARIRIYGRKGQSLSTEMRAMGSYRYGIVNVAASSLLDLFAIYNDALEKLPFRFV